jgi:RNA polymerase sigma factor (sigma-70 family)
MNSSFTPVAVDVAHRNEITMAFLHLVQPIAVALKRRLPVTFLLVDLVQVGTIGLIDAANRFDESRADTFKAYACLRIRGAILDHVQSIYRDRNATVPLHPADHDLAVDEDLEERTLDTQRLELLQSRIRQLTPREESVFADVLQLVPNIDSARKHRITAQQCNSIRRQAAAALKLDISFRLSEKAA